MVQLAGATLFGCYARGISISDGRLYRMVVCRMLALAAVLLLYLYARLLLFWLYGSAFVSAYLLVCMICAVICV